MKKVTTLLMACLTMLGMSAQEMPAPSPGAMVMQRVGLTDVTVNYSRPGVKNRVIFGDLVPYGDLWRTGANKNTTIEVSTDVMIKDQKLKAGTYSIFTIPGEEEWVVIFNKNTNLWGTGGYSQREDALRVRIPSNKVEFVERFSIAFEELNDNGAHLVMSWAETEVAIPLTVEVAKQTEANINQALSDAARAYRNAAEYYSGKGEHDKALMMIDQSIAMSDGWYTNWVKAEILAAKGDKKDAKKQAEKAMAMGEEYYSSRDQEFTYKANLMKEMETW